MVLHIRIPPSSSEMAMQKGSMGGMGGGGGTGGGGMDDPFRKGDHFGRGPVDDKSSRERSRSRTPRNNGRSYYGSSNPAEYERAESQRVPTKPIPTKTMIGRPAQSRNAWQRT